MKVTCKTPWKLRLTNNITYIVGNDQHKSEYSIQKLYYSLFPKKTNEIVLWNKNVLHEKITKIAVDITDFKSAEGQKKLLKNIITLGLGIVQGVTATPSSTEEAVTTLAPTMDSIYGKFSVVSSNSLDHEDFSYTNIALEAHNDNTYWNDPAGLQFFHIISHDGNGGETLLVDGFRCANNLRAKAPEAFDLLCKVPVPAEYIEKECHYFCTDSVLKLDFSKELLQIRYNIRDRALLNTISQNNVAAFYEAYRMLGEEINKEENQFWIKLKPGTLLFVDNWRVLHGRSSFTGTRQFCTSYISRREWTNVAKRYNLM